MKTFSQFGAFLRLFADCVRATRLVIWTALLMFVPAVALAQLSPGPLSKAHSNLEGALQCVKCHSLGVGRPQLKCSGCHMEIAERIQNNRGYHARVADRSKGDADCARCHGEHAGRDFELVRWPSPMSSFDHAQTGYRLEGKHSSLQCNQCHKTESYLGLKTDCASCHQDTHRGQFGASCTTCHSQNSWNAAPQFNHHMTRFPLTGQHAAVACQRCHTPEQTTSTVRYKGLSFAECSACHRDPHRGAFQAPCTQCHNTGGWKATRTGISTNFDHGRTKYPLLGRHVGLECRACHKTSDFSARVASARCTDCHADRHAGQFTRRVGGGDCVSCHTVAGFKTSTYDVAAHRMALYPLTGKHEAVSCEKCHAKKGETTDYHPRFESCVNCHKDAHAGQFKERFADKCESCHKVEGFQPSTFTLARHRDARFPLAGAHAAIACEECHNSSSAGDPHRYRFADRSCTACHRDIHNLAQEQKNCEGCHNQQSWLAVRLFDHGTTRFPLLGPHRTVNCVGCHKPGSQAGGKTIAFRGAPQACASCHEDIHASQFEKLAGGDDCASCHSPASWKPANFDHNRSGYPLDGAHRNVQCASCHKSRVEPRGRQVVVYRETPRECAKCH